VLLLDKIRAGAYPHDTTNTTPRVGGVKRTILQDSRETGSTTNYYDRWVDLLAGGKTEVKLVIYILFMYSIFWTIRRT
jgi:hypothetical protein